MPPPAESYLKIPACKQTDEILRVFVNTRIIAVKSSVMGLKQREALSTYQGALLSMSVLVVLLLPALSSHSGCWHPPAS